MQGMTERKGGESEGRNVREGLKSKGEVPASIFCPGAHEFLDTPWDLGGAAVGHRTRDRKVAGSTPGWGAIKSTRSTQPSVHPG